MPCRARRDRRREPVPRRTRPSSPKHGRVTKSATSATVVDVPRFVTRDQARLALFSYIESFYNPLRRHSSLAMLSPNDYEARYWEDNAAAAAA
jgi:transposase InsO family protein